MKVLFVLSVLLGILISASKGQPFDNHETENSEYDFEISIQPISPVYIITTEKPDYYHPTEKYNYNIAFTTEEPEYNPEVNANTGLNIDITTYNNSLSSNKPVIILQKYTSVCSCENVPYDVSKLDKWSINSYNNEILVYFEPNCLQKKWKALFIDGGENQNAREIGYLRILDNITKLKYKVQSFGPNPNSEIFKTSCIKHPNKAILGLELLETDVKLTKKITFTSIGTAPKTNNLLPISNEQIQFYELPNFQDFVLASESTTTCSNISPENGNYLVTSDIKSIRTDKCVMLYSEINCLGRSTTIQSPGTTDLLINWESTVTGSKTLALLYKSFPLWTWATKSFQRCNNEETNELLNFDITEFSMNLKDDSNPKVLGTFKSVCTCQDISKHVNDLARWSINNYDTSMFAYFEQGCTSNTFEPLWIPPGRSSYSMALGAFHQMNKSSDSIYKILSVGPDLGSKNFKENCVKLFATITKFEINEDKWNYTQQNVDMTAYQTFFTNNDKVPVSQTFTASKTVKDSLSVDIGTTLSSMQSIQLKNKFEVETKMIRNQSENESGNISVKADISGSVSGLFKKLGVELGGSISGGGDYGNSTVTSLSNEEGIKEGLMKAYRNQGITGNSNSSGTTVENTKSFTVSHEITVAPCSEKVVHAYLKTVKNMLIEYRALVKITGNFTTRNMTATEVRQFMGDELQYAGDYDENMVLAYSTGTITADFVVASFMNLYGQNIGACLERFELPQCKPADISTRSSFPTPPPIGDRKYIMGRNKGTDKKKQ